MAHLSSQVGFDQTSPEFNTAYANATGAQLLKNTDYRFNDITYKDMYNVTYSLGQNERYQTSFGGTALTIDSNDIINGGTVTGYFAYDRVGSNYVAVFELQEISISAVTLRNAFATRSEVDDTAVITTLLAKNDRFDLSAFADTASGLTGNDTMFGNGGADVLNGNSGADLLNGGGGNDKLVGGTGKDILIGGTDRDTFIFTAPTDTGNTGSAADVIRDFVSGTDKIDLSVIDASIGQNGNNSFVFDGTDAFSHSANGEIRFRIFNNAGTDNDYTLVYFDRDSDTQSEFVLRLTGVHHLVATDFAL